MGPLILALVVLALALGVYRMLRHRRKSGGPADIPAAVVRWTTQMMSVDRAEWGQAMVGELEQHKGCARWRFALGCAVAAVGLPGDRSGRLVAASVLLAAVASAGLVGCSFLRYPGMLTGTGTWLALATFAIVLAGFVVATGVTIRQSPIGITGLLSGCALALVWIVVGLVSASASSTAPIFLLLILPLASIVVGIAGGRRGRTRTAGRRTALVSAVVSALAVFLVLASDTLITGGQPYDAGQLQDFANSGYQDMATYAVSDNLGTAMVLVLLISAMTFLLCSAGATLATRRSR